MQHTMGEPLASAAFARSSGAATAAPSRKSSSRRPLMPRLSPQALPAVAEGHRNAKPSALSSNATGDDVLPLLDPTPESRRTSSSAPRSHEKTTQSMHQNYGAAYR